MYKAGKPEILRTREMYDLGNGDIVSCNYDFSALSGDYYHGFFNGLPQLLYKKVKSVRFCNDVNTNIENNHNATDQELKQLEQTIKNSYPQYSSYLAKIIAKVLPRAKLLYSLTIDHVPIRNEEFKRIVESIRKCRSLRKITFTNIRITDENFTYFLNNVSPFRLEFIEFSNCHLTSHIYDNVCEFLSRQPPKPSNEWKLKALNLTDNDLTPDNFEIIGAMMQKKAHPNDSDDQTTVTTGDEDNNQFIKNLSKKKNNKNSSEDDLSDEVLNERNAKFDVEEEEEEEEEEDEYENVENAAEKEDEEEYESESDDGKSNGSQPIKLEDPNARSRSQIALENIKNAAATVKPASPSNDPRAKNASLKRELNELLEKVKAVKYNEDVFLIGEGAQDTLNDIRDVEKQIQDYEAEHGEIKV